MIPKGNPHDNAAALGRYLFKTDPDERAYIQEVRGFGVHEMDGASRAMTPRQIIEALKTIEIIAAGTKAQQPFFHGYVRLDDGETIDDGKWVHTADRMEKALGLAGQPRVIAFHENELTGEKHMHIAWSRIDADRMKAINLHKPILKMMRVADELEKEFGLRQLDREQDRDGPSPAKRKELEEARRLGLDVKQVRADIRRLFDHSDGGQAFMAALHDQDMVLTNGTRRDCFVVIDRKGGHHALNKDLLGIKAKAIRARLADIDRSQLENADIVSARIRAEREKERTAERLKTGENESTLHAAPTTGPQRPLSATEQQIRDAAERSAGADFSEALAARGFSVVRVTEPDLVWSMRERILKNVEDERLDRLPWTAQAALGIELEGRALFQARSGYRSQPIGDKKRDGFQGYVASLAEEWRGKYHLEGGVERLREELSVRRGEVATGRRGQIIDGLLDTESRAGDYVAVSEYGRPYLLDARRTGLQPEMMQRLMAGVEVPDGVREIVKGQWSLERARCDIVASMLLGDPSAAWEAQRTYGVAFAHEGGRACVVTATHAQLLTEKQEDALAQLLPLDRVDRGEPESRWRDLPDRASGQRLARYDALEGRMERAIAHGIEASAIAGDGGLGFVRFMSAAGYDVVTDKADRLHLRRGNFVTELSGHASPSDLDRHLAALSSKESQLERIQSHTDRADQRALLAAEREAERRSRAEARALADLKRQGRRIGRAMRKVVRPIEVAMPLGRGTGKVLGGILGGVTDLVANAGRFEEQEARAMSSPTGPDRTPAEREATRNPVTIGTPDVERAVRDHPRPDMTAIQQLRWQIDSARRQREEAELEQARQRGRER